MPKPYAQKYDEAVGRAQQRASMAMSTPAPGPVQAALLICIAERHHRHGEDSVRQHFGIRTSPRNRRGPDPMSLTAAEIADLVGRGQALKAVRDKLEAEAEKQFNARIASMISTTAADALPAGGAKKAGVKATTAAVHRKKGSNARRKATASK